MFIAKKNRQLIDYQNSYYCQLQRKKRRYKWLKFSLVLLIIIVLSFVLIPFAQSKQAHLENINNENPLIHGPQLQFKHPTVVSSATFPVDIQANIEINGLVAYAEIKQTFINPYSIALEGKYQFPLPENSAVKQLKVKIGDREIMGEIKEKKIAKKLYQQAKKQGKKASLVEQKRPNLFSNKIANIPAQSSVIVTLKLVIPITFSADKFNLRLPLAMTEKYHPQSAVSSSKQSIKPSNDNLYNRSYKQSLNQLPKPVSITTADFPSTGLQAIAKSQSSINITLNSGVPITSIISNSHKIHSRSLNSEQNAYFITLNKAHVISDKSFVLTWQLIANEHPQISSFTQEVSGEHYTLLTIFPPKAEAAQILARDIIFIIDTSGSMQGGSMEQAKASLQLALLQLNDKDSFNIIAFDNESELLFPITQMASEKTLNKAQNFIDNLSADGGTEMYRPLSNALMMKRAAKQSKKAIRQIVFVTDGAVANEFELMQLINSAQGDFRLYTVGIGAAPNGYFMKKAAQFGRGSYVFIQKHNEVQQKMTNFMNKISQPALTNIKVILDNQTHQQGEFYPKRIPDLYFGEPLQIALKSQVPINSVQLTGETVSDSFYKQLIINNHQESKGISLLWARRKIEDLLDSLVIGANKEQVRNQVIATSLTHQIMSPYTSFIAIEKQHELAPLLAKNNLSARKRADNAKAKNSAMQTHQSLLVAMPQTSIGWQLQFIIGIALLLLVKVINVVELTTRYIKSRE